MPRSPKEFYETVGGRRFLFACALTALSAFLLVRGNLSGTNFVDLISVTVIALVLGHSSDKYANRNTGGQ